MTGPERSYRAVLLMTIPFQTGGEQLLIGEQLAEHKGGPAASSPGTLGGEPASLDEESQRFQKVFAHLYVRQLGALREPQLLAETVQHCSVQIGPLVKQIEQLLSGR